MSRVSERVAVPLLAILCALALLVAPWGAINRETGARSAVVLLPDRVVDFTGRTNPVDLPAQGAILVLTLVGYAAAAAGGLLRGRYRYGTWLAAGVILIGGTLWGFDRFEQGVTDARKDAFAAEVQRALDNPRPNLQVEKLQLVLDEVADRSLSDNLLAAEAAGLVVRRLPYTNSGMGLSAFLALVTGALALLFGLRILPGASRVIDRVLRGAAVPAISIFLALLAAAVVILALQSTPAGSSVAIDDFFTYLVGRIDTLWYAYYSMFHDSLGTINGLAESLKFTTPLIFTGLAVAFGFQAGLFNIGAPGQMLMGAVFAMFAGLYIPGPRIVVLPLAILAAALGGGLWGALPGWLKARFGANEVINTILLNFVAASVLLFILSSGNVFAAAAVRIIIVIGVFVLLVILLSLLKAVRQVVRRAPRLVMAAALLLLLGGVVVGGLPRPGDRPVTLQMPFKVPGNEPKSKELNVAARLPQLPAVLGITRSGVNVVTLDYGLLIAPLALLAGLALLPRWRRLRPWRRRLPAALGLGLLAYGVAWLVGWTHVPTAIPPTKLNLSFLLALLMAVVVHVVLFRTRWGYELRAVGLSPRAAEYGGANIARNTVWAMAISGALAGLTATHYVLGGALEDYALRQSIPSNDGFDGIAVALLGANQPIFIVLSAFLFGVLKYGGAVLNITFPNLTREVVSMILALVVLFIAARGFLPQRLLDPRTWLDATTGPAREESNPTRTTAGEES